ncbi:hypothetical protein QW180_26130 [Vibrio sinaloensis]|nr:hypothetical protein [Vibrio sinaloensis]
MLDGLANVVGNDGIDVTEQFVSGAENALELCKKTANKVRDTR